MQMYNMFNNRKPFYITEYFEDFDPLINGRPLNYEEYQKILQEDSEFEEYEEELKKKKKLKFW